MATPSSPPVLGLSFVLLAVFVASWRYQFGELPPLRATAVVGLGALIVVYSLASIPEVLADPLHYAVVIAGMLVLSAVWSRVRRLIRT
ncbi:hypothetical protein [Halohasta litorea]|uniref:Uncharacterized protein n=1 Tax=Halohasta litorea TaxID=869891 RepID=A0ABD6DBQ5_9EURY|nr:hypothetical protein [Halohasta litorea]